MLRVGMSKVEIIDELEKHGDFVKIDYLTKFINQNHPRDMKMFLYSRLAMVYEKMRMYVDVAKIYDKMATISIAFSEKIKNHLREAEFYMKANRFEEIQEVMKKALGHANASQKQDIFFTIRNMYQKQAESYEQSKKYSHAVQVYEKLLDMQISEHERTEVRNKLEKLRDYLRL